MAFEWLIRGGTVLDRTGGPGRPADVGLSGDRVAAVAPGFIDMHTHSDFALLAHPSAEAKVRQGVTTEVTGMCGFSPAPSPPGAVSSRSGRRSCPPSSTGGGPASPRGQVSMIQFLMLDANVARGLQFPHVTIGSDNLGLCAGPEEAPAGKPHPRLHGCFAKVLGTYVRERAVLSWGAAIHKMTGQAAARLGLPDRGVLRPGAVADVVVFDPRTVDDLATYQAPHRYPAGIRWVWVNGGAVLEAGRFHACPTGHALTSAR